ncbi:hypothetical protein PZ78_15975 [Vreelandella venusta]|nr:hypothetical protein PZ78_15975 [Halomonas hydrothermalis]
MSTKTIVLDTLIALLEQKGESGTERVRQNIDQDPDFMLGRILDSVDKVEFFLLLEEACKINISDEDQDQLETFAHVVEYVDNETCH